MLLHMGLEVVRPGLRVDDIIELAVGVDNPSSLHRSPSQVGIGTAPCHLAVHKGVSTFSILVLPRMSHYHRHQIPRYYA